jgi:hypothetical protein
LRVQGDETQGRAKVGGDGFRACSAPCDALAPHVDLDGFLELRDGQLRQSTQIQLQTIGSENRADGGEQGMLTLREREAVLADENEAPIVLEPERPEHRALDLERATGFHRIDVQRGDPHHATRRSRPCSSAGTTGKASRRQANSTSCARPRAAIMRPTRQSSSASGALAWR